MKSRIYECVLQYVSTTMKWRGGTVRNPLKKLQANHLQCLYDAHIPGSKTHNVFSSENTLANHEHMFHELFVRGKTIEVRKTTNISWLIIFHLQMTSFGGIITQFGSKGFLSHWGSPSLGPKSPSHHGFQYCHGFILDDLGITFSETFIVSTTLILQPKVLEDGGTPGRWNGWHLKVHCGWAVASSIEIKAPLGFHQEKGDQKGIVSPINYSTNHKVYDPHHSYARLEHRKIVLLNKGHHNFSECKPDNQQRKRGKPSF